MNFKINLSTNPKEDLKNHRQSSFQNKINSLNEHDNLEVKVNTLTNLVSEMYEEIKSINKELKTCQIKPTKKLL